uniref:Phosphate-binding protein n=1 Tax=Ignisphaera aggregans TaxID=334771 RepID=A0A7C4BD83_9CREN
MMYMRRSAIIVMLIAVTVVIIATYSILQIYGGSREPLPSATSTPTPTITASTNTQLQGVVLQGAGATFVYPQISEWAKRFQERYGIQINYQSVGSGAGQSMFFQKVVDFGCSDPPLSRDTWLKYNGSVLQVPWLFGPVVLVYNIPELPKSTALRLDAIAIAKIYKGEIRYWNDEYVKGLNPDIAHLLPNKEIVAVYRSDSSGTTELFTTFLYKASGGVWTKDLVGKSISWPVEATGRGVGGKGNEGVTQNVMQIPYSIGYVEWSYAIKNNLSIAAIKNAAGNFVLPMRETLEEALKNAKIPTSPLDDFSGIVDSVIYVAGEKSYPILGPTHIILWRSYDNPKKVEALKLFLKWVAEEGYNHIVEGYVAPPQSVKELLIKAANEIVSQ